MNITTARCTIREFTEADIDAFMRYRNDEDWMRYQGFKGLTKAAYTEALCGEALLEEGRQFAIVDTASGQLVGDIFLKRDDDIYWIGYTVAPEHSRHGYATEACDAVICWIAEHGGKTIVAESDPQNVPSIALLKKLGFSYLKEENGALIFALDCESVQRSDEIA